MAWKYKPKGWAGSIYTATNLVNGLQYVGLAEVYETRWANHAKALKRAKRSNQYVHHAMAAYGIENFKFEVVQHCRTIETMCKAEQRWIRRLHTFVADSRGGGYNLTKGGDGVLGLRHSKASRKKMSLAHLLRYMTDPAAREAVAAATKLQMADMVKYTRWRTGNATAHKTHKFRTCASIAQRKRFEDPAQCAAMSHGFTIKARKQMSKSAKARWAELPPEKRAAYWRATHPNGNGGGGHDSHYDGINAEERKAYWRIIHPNGSGGGRSKKAA